MTGAVIVAGTVPGMPTRTAPPADSEVAARLDRRYPRPRVSRRVVTVVVALLAVAGLSWTVWTGLDMATPAVAGRLDTYDVISDTETRFTLSVERPDPSQAATCRVIAQADNFERVGELSVEIPPGDQQLIRLDVELRTFRRAVSVSLDGCTVL